MKIDRSLEFNGLKLHFSLVTQDAQTHSILGADTELTRRIVDKAIDLLRFELTALADQRREQHGHL